MKFARAFFGLAVLAGCAAHRGLEVFRVVPARPEYRLRAPDSQETRFADVLSGFTPAASAWVELRPGMELRIENAYYREGSTRRVLADFLGTEVAHYQVRPGGRLRLLSIDSDVKQQPADQPGVQRLIPGSQAGYRHHRFFYEILLNRKAELRGAVLLGAQSAGELERLAGQLVVDPGLVCDGSAARCTVFPEKCTVSLEIEIAVNGVPRTVLWGSSLATIAPRPRHLEVQRLYRGRMTPVMIDASDPAALRLPLLPGDRIQWD